MIARPFAVSPDYPPNSPIFPRSSTGSYVWNAWFWSESGRTGSAADADASLAELAALAETAGSEVLEGLIQRRDKPDPSTHIGSGKALELRQIVVATGADTVICDGELSPAQLTALERW